MAILTRSDRVLQAGACAGLELAARKGRAALEAAGQSFTARQRGFVPRDYLDQLRRETAAKGN